MTQEEILLGNKLVAEFMGYVLHDLGDGKSPYYSHNDKYFKPKAIIRLDKGEVLEYHTSWDWLKPVIDEIQTYRLAYPDLTEGVRNLSIFVDILPAWRAVVKFIQQYNQNK